MNIDAPSYSQALKIIAQRREKAVDRAQEKRDALVKLAPEYADHEKAIARTSILITKSLLSEGINIEEAMKKIAESNLDHQKRMQEILSENGVDTIEPDYECKECFDTGFIDGKPCECLLELIKKLRYEKLNSITPLSLCSFDTFDLKHYPEESNSSGISPRKLMTGIYRRCVDYAENFSLDSDNLLFQGGVGLGKTHLSLAIAKAAIEKGYGVVYGSAQHFLSKIEAEHFGRAATDDNTLELCKSCDLLILDDLGVEFSTAFTIATIHDLIDTRLCAGRPTIISTNLQFDDLEKRYTERMTSRIYGNYKRYQFIGGDVRIKLRIARKDGYAKPM